MVKNDPNVNYSILFYGILNFFSTRVYSKYFCFDLSFKTVEFESENKTKHETKTRQVQKSDV